MFCPTDRAVSNIQKTGVKEGIYKTGNTVIDALLYCLKEKSASVDFINLDPNLKTILLTSHRRENFGEPLKNICLAARELIEKRSDIQIVYPMHLNPNVRDTVIPILGGVERVHLIEPLDYVPFCNLMKHSNIILTDSGAR